MPSGTKLLPTGCCLLNLALSDSIEGGYGCGRLVNMIGDSSSGKSMLALTGLAEVAADPSLEDLVLLYDGCEAPDFDIPHLFGNRLYQRMQDAWKLTADVCGLHSYYPPETIQQYYSRMLQLYDAGHEVISILDSFDAISTTEELSRAEQMTKGKESGSYKMEKARWASEVLRVLCGRIKDTRSATTIISQTRDNIEPIGFQKKTRAGGKALEFYACHIFWLAKALSLKSKNKLKIGANVIAKTTKNKLTGKWRDARFPIYYQIGVDDVGAAVDFLLDNSTEWVKSGPQIKCPSLDLKGYKNDVLKVIDDDADLWAEVREQLQAAWDAQETDANLNRSPRFE